MSFATENASAANIALPAQSTGAPTRLSGALACRQRRTIADDGIGGASTSGGSGLRGLADRVEALGGRLTVSSPPGRGTSATTTRTGSPPAGSRFISRPRRSCTVAAPSATRPAALARGTASR
jgi:hypothetical protein